MDWAKFLYYYLDMLIADLHVHSNNSDGSDSTKRLLENIIQSGIRIFALTDHDSVEGCMEMESIVPKGIKFIPSIELTCCSGNIKCHVLGYNCDCRNKKLLDLVEKGKKLRRYKLETRINYLKDTWNIILSEEELNWLYSRKSVVKTHIANILVNRGLEKNNVSAMKKYLDGCKSGDTRFTIEEAVEAIMDAGGIPVWAHPLGGEGEEHDSEAVFVEKLEKIIEYGIQGLECYYSRYSKSEAELLVKYAKKYNLLVSGGSDYHGINKNIPLGRLCSDNSKVDAKLLDILNKI